MQPVIDTSLAKFRKLVLNRADKAGLSADDQVPLGELITRLQAKGVELESDRTVAKSFLAIQNSLPAVTALLAQGVSPFWSSSAKLDDQSESRPILGYHPAAVSGMHSRSLVHQQGVLHNAKLAGTNEEMIASNLLRLMLGGVLASYHFASGHIDDHWVSLLQRPAVQFGIATELSQSVNGDYLLQDAENLLRVGVMFAQIKADIVVEALQDHPLWLCADNDARDNALHPLVAAGFDFSDTDTISHFHTTVATFMGIEPLHESIDRSLCRACMSPMSSEGSEITKVFLHGRLKNLVSEGRVDQALHWLPIAAGLARNKGDHIDPALHDFWLHLAARPNGLSSTPKYLRSLKDPAFLRETLTSIDQQSWVTMLTAAWSAELTRDEKLDLLVGLKAEAMAEYPVIRHAVLEVIASEIRNESGALAFLQQEDIQKFWKGYRDGAMLIAASVGVLLEPDYTTASGIAWFDLLKHPDQQQALVAKLPRDPDLLAKLDDTGLESALASDLGL
jgi:hypothetical protein